MKKALLILPAARRSDQIFAPAQIQRLQERLEFVAPPLTAEALLKKPEILKSVEVIFSTWGMPRLDEALLAAAPNLKDVYYCAGSVKKFVTDASYAKGVRIYSAWGANAVPVTEFTLAQIILSLKNFWSRALNRDQPLCPIDDSQIEGCAGAYGSTVGLLSLGQIGLAVANRLKAFDLEVIAYDPFAKPEKAAQAGVTLVDLNTVFKNADVVSCHTPWLPQTEKMLKACHFSAMKPGATFINTARGAVVNEADLVAVLERRPDLTALLDVTHPEPPEETSPLRRLPNLIRTPHIAGSLQKECQRMTEFMIEEFDRVERGGRPKWRVSKRLAARLA